jgi:hypothetical protein
MIDPVPVGYIELDRAVLRRAAGISDREYQERMHQFRAETGQPEQQSQDEAEMRRRQDGEPENSNSGPASLSWAKREFAINDLYAALCDSGLLALVRDPTSGQMFQLTASDWRGAVFWRDIVVSGVVRSSAGEEIKRHDGRRVLLKADQLDLWLKKLERCQPQPAEEACGKWLEDLMRQSPTQRPKPKPELRDEAVRRFSVSGRKFDRIWDDKRKVTGANWGEPGAPSKL